MRWRGVVLSTVLTLAAVASASAQRFASVVVGTQVRIVTADGTVTTGEFVGLRGDTALIARATVVPSTGPALGDQARVGRAIAVTDIRTYAIRVRSKSLAVYGALAGGGLALALIHATRSPDVGCDRDHPCGELPLTSRGLAVRAALVLVAAGTAIGAAVGPARWRVAQGAYASIVPVQSGVGVVCSVRF